MGYGSAFKARRAKGGRRRTRRSGFRSGRGGYRG